VIEGIADGAAANVDHALHVLVAPVQGLGKIIVCGCDGGRIAGCLDQPARRIELPAPVSRRASSMMGFADA
jgi:hypothetical protein